jgi:predicted RNA polymerase sigma factor
MFICCDEAIPRESQLVLALKTLGGFSTGEIALRLFTSEANVHKRLVGRETDCAKPRQRWKRRRRSRSCGRG